jgi:hypothetical protein
MLHIFDLRPVNARYVRINVTKTRFSAGGLYYAQIAEIAVWEPITSFLLTLSWTEPGARGAPGKVSSFDVRYSTSPIATEAQFAAADQLTGEPGPRGSGLPQTFSFEPPEEGTTLYFRMKYVDKDGNVSALSNQASGTVAIIAPSAVRDLAAHNIASTSVDLSFAATGDDERSGTAASFDIRYAPCPLDGGNFAAATDAGVNLAPAVAGTRQRATVSGLAPATTYCFAMKVVDDAGAISDISNVVSATTDAPDTAPPSEVVDLRGSTPFTLTPITARAIAASSAAGAATAFGKATDGNVSSYWGSAGSRTPAAQWITLDIGSSHLIGHVGLLSRSAGTLFPEEVQVQVSEDNSSYETVLTASGLPATRGLKHDLVFPATNARYVRIRTTKPRATVDGAFYVQIAEIQVNEAAFVHGPVTLRWTAPGDDGPNGKAVSYDLRYSRNPIADGSFAEATPVPGEPTPQEAGAVETMEVNLARGRYYFALRTKDESGNQSGISNVPSIFVP